MCLRNNEQETAKHMEPTKYQIKHCQKNYKPVD